MTSDQIAILALLVALATPLTAWVVARARSDHELRLAREGRYQQRREVLYVDLLEYAHTLGDWVERRHPIFAYASDPPPPALPDDAVLRRLRARGDALGSPLVLERLDRLGAAIRAFSLTALELDDRQHGPEVRAKLGTERETVRDAIADLAAACREDLSPGGSAT